MTRSLVKLQKRSNGQRQETKHNHQLPFANPHPRHHRPLRIHDPPMSRNATALSQDGHCNFTEHLFGSMDKVFEFKDHVFVFMDRASVSTDHVFVSTDRVFDITDDVSRSIDALFAFTDDVFVSTYRDFNFKDDVSRFTDDVFAFLDDVFLSIHPVFNCGKGSFGPEIPPSDAQTNADVLEMRQSWRKS